MELNNCVFEKLVCTTALRHIAQSDRSMQGLKKTIPGAPEGETPVHLRPKQIYANWPGKQY